MHYISDLLSLAPSPHFFSPFILIFHVHLLLKQDQPIVLFVELSLWRILAQNSYDQKIADYMLSLLTQNTNGITLFCMPTNVSNVLTEISEFDAQKATTCNFSCYHLSNGFISEDTYPGMEKLAGSKQTQVYRIFPIGS